jgi:transcriptional regulator with XRE-family HTH domain
MLESQKQIITQLLKEKGKSKRELAVYLGIHENGINRVIGNQKIKKDRLEAIAAFLGMDSWELLHKIYPEPASSEDSGYLSVHESPLAPSEEIILLLSDVIRGQKQISEMEIRNSERLAELMRLLLHTQSFSK